MQIREYKADNISNKKNVWVTYFKNRILYLPCLFPIETSLY